MERREAAAQRARQEAYRSKPAPPQSYEQEVEISLYEAYHGGKRLLELDGRRLEVKISIQVPGRVPKYLVTSSCSGRYARAESRSVIGNQSGS